MKHSKFAAAILVLLTVAIVAPAIPRGHADDNSETMTATGYALRSNYNYDPYFGTYVNAIKSGSVLMVTVIYQADYEVMQRNMSMGIKFDYMTSFQNSSMANPQNSYTVFANQIVYLTLNYTVPALTGGFSGLNLVMHSFYVEVWNGASGATWTNGCGYGYTGEYYGYVGSTYKYLGSCHEFYPTQVALYSAQQVTDMQAREQAEQTILALKEAYGGYCSSGSTCFINSAPGTSSAAAAISAASTAMLNGDNAYANGDFNGAVANYQAAQNDANAAQSSLATTGGGIDTGTLTSIWIEAVAVLFGGIGALLVGIAGFKYLRSRTRAMSGYTPSVPKA